jgi:hypothetical protein
MIMMHLILGRKTREKNGPYISLSSVMADLCFEHSSVPLLVHFYLSRCGMYSLVSLSGVVNRSRIALISYKKGDHKEGFLCQRKSINIPHSFASRKARVSFFILSSWSVIIVYWDSERCFIGLYVLCLWNVREVWPLQICKTTVSKACNKLPFGVPKALVLHNWHRRPRYWARRYMHLFACQRNQNSEMVHHLADLSVWSTRTWSMSRHSECPQYLQHGLSYVQPNVCRFSQSQNPHNLCL